VCAVEDGVEDGCKSCERARNGASTSENGRLLLDEFGHPILRLRSGPVCVDTLVMRSSLGLDGEDTITLQPQFAIALMAVQTKMRPTSNICEVAHPLTYGASRFGSDIPE